jgi:hypothetical protein
MKKHKIKLINTNYLNDNNNKNDFFQMKKLIIKKYIENKKLKSNLKLNSIKDNSFKKYFHYLI